VLSSSFFVREVFSRISRRKTINLLLQPNLQLKLPLYVLLLTLMFALLLWAVLCQGFEGFYEFLMLQSNVGEQIGPIIKYQTNAVIMVLSVMTIAYVILIIGLSVVYLHRLVGSTIAFSRHVRALRNGEYSSRIKLRKNDAFWELAQDMNDLAASLECKGQAEKS
jgi:methyl-accepting chemotaxis protein